MSARGPIDERMLRWEAARRLGTELTADELCADCPEHADALRSRIRAVRAMEALLGVAEDDPQRTLPAHAGNGAEGGPLPIIPGYEIRRVLARGGMGVVYEACQAGLGRLVAVKMISAARLAPRVVARFRREAEAAARLQHPHFVPIFEVGQVEGQPFYSMEYVAGGSLADLLARQTPTARQAAELIATLAGAVQSAHERGVVHRDLKPSNVLLQIAEGGLPKETPADPTAVCDLQAAIPKIADFGLAKLLDLDAAHTHTGEILGTPSYMAPEQADGHGQCIGPATDVYALGAILYELLTGKPPFSAATPLAALKLVLAHDLVPPSRLAPAVPRDLEAICLKCLEQAPRHRYESAQALADDLRRFLAGEPVAVRRSIWIRRAWAWGRRRPWTAAGCAVAAALALVAALPLVNDYRTRRAARLTAERQAPAVREILQRACFECHGQDPRHIEKNLHVLDHPNLIDSARKIVVPGAPEDSRLIQRITDGSMPPEEEEVRLPRLSERELTILKEWIAGGAPPFGPAEETATPAPRSASAARVKAIFHERCYECHKFDVAKGGIKILHHRLLVAVRKVVVPGQPENSELYQLVTTDDDDVRMPPAPAERLTPPEIDAIRAWIRDGAPPFPKSE